MQRLEADEQKRQQLEPPGLRLRSPPGAFGTRGSLTSKGHVKKEQASS